MARFNEKNKGTKTVNRAGGEAYKQSNELEFISILLTSFVKDKFYERTSDTLERLRDLIQKLDPVFVAKAAIYARHSFGMRSITHVIASELGTQAKDSKWGKYFYEKIIRRPDDILEILSYHKSKGEKVSNSMKKGLGMALNKFDAYQLAKYRGESRDIKLVDAMNILHPKPKDEEHQVIFNKLINGDLKSEKTWESKISATQGDETEKNKSWGNLIDNEHLGYFALLRNLRNIISYAPEKIDKVCSMLTNRQKIQKSLVLPFRFLTAMKALEEINVPRKLINSLHDALDISLDNVPKFDGNNLVVLDVSGSMTFYGHMNPSAAEIGSIFATALYKKNESDFMIFDSHARYQNLNPRDSVISLVNQIDFSGNGTNIRLIFETANKYYDRIIIITDGQGWIGHNTPHREINEFKERTGSNPIIYNFDLSGYGDMQFPESNTYCIAGFSEKVFDIMKLLESDKKALLNKINSISI